MDPYIPPAPATDFRTADVRTGGADALIQLHQRTVDVLAGYAMMVEKAEASFRDTAEAFRALHARHADRLARIIADQGHTPDADGTFMGTINKAVVSLRAMFDEIDDDVMDNVRDGEKIVLEAFDDAISATDDMALTRDLGDMRADTTALLDRTAHLD
jgi:hypothetical protein